MRKLCMLLVLIIILISMPACDNHTKDNGKVSDNNGQHFVGSVCSKEYVSEFMDIIGDAQYEGLLSGADFSEDFCYNVTPQSIAEQTDYKIFKFSNTCSSFVLIDEKVYELCMSFGGYGFVNALPCDFDANGNIDLLVASSFGSGMHRSQISIFNVTTKESTVLFDTSETENPNMDLIVSAQTPSQDNSANPLPAEYAVYRVTIDASAKNLADLSYSVHDVIGKITLEKGSPTFLSNK